MKPNELFNHIWETQYNKSGFDLDWKVEIDDKERKIRLMFQPSTSIKDWIVNIAGFLPIFKFPLFYCWGWKTVYDNCKDLIFEEVARKLNTNNGYTLEICGHSYGGAMAIVSALDIAYRGGIQADVITFGSPRPLFLLWSKVIGKLTLDNVTQYAHWSDVVTYCPPLLGYHNVTVKRVGKFSFKGLFNPQKYHMSYGDESLYKEVK